MAKNTTSTNVLDFPKNEPDPPIDDDGNIDLNTLCTAGKQGCTVWSEGDGRYSVRDSAERILYSLIPGKSPRLGRPRASRRENANTIAVKNDVAHLLEALCNHAECPEWLKEELFDLINEGQPELFSATFWTAALTQVSRHFEHRHPHLYTDVSAAKEGSRPRG